MSQGRSHGADHRCAICRHLCGCHGRQLLTRILKSREVTGRDSEPWEIIYFKLYKTQIPVVEHAMEMATLMLGMDKSRGYCLEMICADFLAGASLEEADQSMLIHSLSRLIKFLPDEQRQHLFSQEAHQVR
jgi:hypothetical protein